MINHPFWNTTIYGTPQLPPNKLNGFDGGLLAAFQGRPAGFLNGSPPPTSCGEEIEELFKALAEAEKVEPRQVNIVNLPNL